MESCACWDEKDQVSEYKDALANVKSRKIVHVTVHTDNVAKALVPLVVVSQPASPASLQQK